MRHSLANIASLRRSMVPHRIFRATSSRSIECAPLHAGNQRAGCHSSNRSGGACKAAPGARHRPSLRSRAKRPEATGAYSQAPWNIDGLNIPYCPDRRGPRPMRCRRPEIAERYDFRIPRQVHRPGYSDTGRNAKSRERQQPFFCPLTISSSGKAFGPPGLCKEPSATGKTPDRPVMFPLFRFSARWCPGANACSRTHRLDTAGFAKAPIDDTIPPLRESSSRGSSVRNC